MRALHRISGDFPRRGFGSNIMSPDFTPENGPVLKGTASRILVDSSLFADSLNQDGTVTERQAIWELLPLEEYGKQAVVYSAVSATVQRAHTFTDAVLPSEPEASVRDLLCFNGFLPQEDFWCISKERSLEEYQRIKNETLDNPNTTDPYWIGIPAEKRGWNFSDWTAADPGIVSVNRDQEGNAYYQEPVGDMLRAFLARYWHAASMQFFGPWDGTERTTLKYVTTDDPVMSMKAPAALNVILGPQRNHRGLISATKAFVNNVLLANLPEAAHRVISVSAAVPAKNLQICTSSAMRVVFCDDQSARVDIDLRNGGKTEHPPKATEDELALIGLILEEKGKLSGVPYLAGILEKLPEERANRLRADWNVLLTLYQIRKTVEIVRDGNRETASKLVRYWYRLYHLLRDRRHVGSEAQCSDLMRELDLEILGCLPMDAELLKPQKLQSFFWNKLMTCGRDDRWEKLQDLTAACQGPAARPFVSVLIDGGTKGKATVVDDKTAEIAAPALKKILERHYTDGRMDKLHRDGFQKDLYVRTESLKKVLTDYTEKEIKWFEGSGNAETKTASLQLLPLVYRFSPEPGKDVRRILTVALINGKSYSLTEDERALVRDAVENNREPETEALLNTYLADCFLSEAVKGDDLKALTEETGMAKRTDDAAAIVFEREAAGLRRLPEEKNVFILREFVSEKNERFQNAIRGYSEKVLLSGATLLNGSEKTLLKLALNGQNSGSRTDEAYQSYVCRCFDAFQGDSETLAAQLKAVGAPCTGGICRAIRQKMKDENEPRMTDSQTQLINDLGSKLAEEKQVRQACGEYITGVLFSQDRLLRESECRMFRATYEEAKDLPSPEQKENGYLVRTFRDARVQGDLKSYAAMLQNLKPDTTPVILEILKKSGEAGERLDRGASKILLQDMAEMVPEGRQYRVRDAVDQYLQVMLEHSVANNDSGFLEWQQMITGLLGRETRAGEGETSQNDQMRVTYIVNLYSKNNEEPSRSDFAALRSTSEQDPPFAGRAREVRNLYEKLLNAGNETAEKQFLTLAKTLGRLPGTEYPSLRKSLIARMREELTSIWDNGSDENGKPITYWDGIDQTIDRYPDSGISQTDIAPTDGSPFQEKARKKAEEELKKIRTAEGLRAENEKSAKGRDGFGAYWQQAVIARCAELFPELLMSCGSAQELRELQETAEQIGLSQDLADQTGWRCMTNTLEQVEKLDNQPEQGVSGSIRQMKAVQRGLQLSEYGDYRKMIAAVLSKQAADTGAKDFTSRLTFSYLVSDTLKGTPDWNGIIRKLCPQDADARELVRHPVGLPSLNRLSVVTSLLKLTAPGTPLESDRDSLVSYLKSDRDTVAWLNAVMKHKKASGYLSAETKALLK